MSQNILFIGTDVHRESIEIALADGANTEIRRYGKIGGIWDAMRKTLRKRVSLGKPRHFCYEVGPCGYGLYRHQRQKATIAGSSRRRAFRKRPVTKSKPTNAMRFNWLDSLSYNV